MEMSIEKQRQIAERYAARGPQTLLSFLAEHGLKERDLRKALKVAQNVQSAQVSPSDRQVPLPFKSKEPKASVQEQIARLEEENKRLRGALIVAKLALKIVRDKADGSVNSLEEVLG